MENKMIRINQAEVSIKEYKGQRVVTFKDIDAVHNRAEGTAKRNFIENKDRLILNEDYFEITKGQKNEIRTLEIPNRGITVLTESGYLMLVKSFTDDLAWEVQRELVKSYFRVKEEEKGKPDTAREALAQAKLNNARARVSNQWLKIAELVAIPEYKAICASYASGALAGGNPVLPLPQAGERHMTAKEVGERLGISANKVGIIANRAGLKTEEYGKWYRDKSRYSSKEVDTFRYNEKAIQRFKEMLGK